MHRSSGPASPTKGRQRDTATAGDTPTDPDGGSGSGSGGSGRVWSPGGLAGSHHGKALAFLATLAAALTAVGLLMAFRRTPIILRSQHRSAQWEAEAPPPAVAGAPPPARDWLSDQQVHQQGPGPSVKALPGSPPGDTYGGADDSSGSGGPRNWGAMGSWGALWACQHRPCCRQRPDAPSSLHA